MMASSVRRFFSALTAVLLISALLLVSIEAAVGLLIGPPPDDPRDGCAQKAGKEELRVFVYGGSTVYGTPIPKLGFVAQLRADLKEHLGEGRYRICNFGEPGLDSTRVVIDLKRTLRYEPDVVIVFTGHNEFLGRLYQPVWARELREWISSLAIVRYLQQYPAESDVSNHSRAGEGSVVMPPELHHFDRNSWEFEARLRRYRNNIETIVDLASTRDVPLVLGTLPSNVRDWPPAYKTLPQAEGGVSNEGAVAEILRSLRQGDTDSARSRYHSLPESDRATPVGRYLMARIRVSNGAASGEELYRIKDADPIPWRVLSAFNEYVREQSLAHRLVMVDVERTFAERSPSGAIGFDLVADNCHPTPLGNRFVAESLLPIVLSHLHGENSVLSLPNQDGGADERLKRYLTTLDDSESAMTNYLLLNATYSMKVPFYNNDASKMYLRQAADRTPADWRIWANLGALAYLEGNSDRGTELVGKAIELGATPEALLSRSNVPYMREALAGAGLNPDSLIRQHH